MVVLAGGRGTRLGSAGRSAPKPLVEVGGRPILWHILSLYAAAGVEGAIVAAGYRGDEIRAHVAEAPGVAVVDTGLDTNTGGRVRRLADLLPETFCLTYGDGLSDVRIRDVLGLHRRQGAIATVTAVRPPSRFGHLSLSGDRVTGFSEKSYVGEHWINGGFMVLQREVLDWIPDDTTSLERDVLTKLATEGQLVGFRHDGFWQCMDTAEDVALLNSLWEKGNAPWRTW